jgi:hypothetical protein
VEGYVENTGDVTVEFVTVDVRWQDWWTEKVVDTDWTYAVGAEGLRPGERSTFSASSDHEDADECLVELSGFRLP